jgi:DNA helicase-2/ATP-dependent DNA helicase PcrA
MVTWTAEQQAILQHDSNRHGRVLAGPGTGKSTTILSLAAILQESIGVPGSVKVVTFTRAATAELTLKAIEGDHGFAPRTLHSTALSLLMSNPGLSGLPEPLRIPDEWEQRNLVQPDIARRLRDRGFEADIRKVRRLEAEMAAQWESLGDEPLLADLDPDLRNGYLAVWSSHREIFGYSLHAEMPLYAKQLLEDYTELYLHDLSFLVVDEYQDLNRCEIGLLEALSSFDVRILAVGDDDQSIYGFRMADPSGIVEFQQFFPDSDDYSMSISHRCGRTVLDAARVLIESAPTRAPKASLKPGDDNPDGVFAYLRFASHTAETRGVALLVKYLIETQGLKPDEIVVMMRADFNSQWSTPLREALQGHGIASTDVEHALEPLSDPESRRAIALARLAVHREDDLAWWTIMDQTYGIAPEFVAQVADEARERGIRFAARLLTIDDDPPDNVTTFSLSTARDTVTDFSQQVEGLDVEGAPQSENGWADWLIDSATALGVNLNDAFVELARSVGRVTPQEEGLNHFLNQLEPVTKDQALETPAVSIMSMSRSKGLTRRAAVVMGVEEGVVPNPRNKDIEEERRLLYVAMTRPREFLYLTMARKRTGPTAYTGSPNPKQRGRSEFFRNTPIAPVDGPTYLRELLS